MAKHANGCWAKIVAVYIALLLVVLGSWVGANALQRTDTETVAPSSPANNIGYDPVTPADWSIVPREVGSALDLTKAVVAANRDFFNGTFLESFDALVTSDGATVTMSIEQSGGGDLIMRFSDGRTTLDCTPAATIALTAGSDASPTGNFIYIPQGTKALTKSTSDWPSAEHIKIAYFLVPSAGFVQTNGVYVNHNTNDHAQGADNQGHLSHITDRLRSQHAIYKSGVALTITVGGGATVDAAVTAGVVYQMHQHATPALNTATGDAVLVVNQNGAAYDDVTDLETLTNDSAGVAVKKYFNWVIWGVGNKGGEYSSLMLNLPTGSYNQQASAESDVSGYDVLTIPSAFSIDSQTGFLIARVTMSLIGGTWAHVSTVDLRGATPQTVVGGVGGVDTEFADNAFKLFDEGDNTKILDFQLSGITTGNTRTITAADANIDLAPGSGSFAAASHAHEGTAILSTGPATDGHVLTADGAGAAAWEAVPGGGGGETNTASNQGTDGVGVYDTKVGVDLQFRHVAPASSKISVVLNSKDIDLDVVEANLSLANLGTRAHANLTGVGTDDHHAQSHTVASHSDTTGTGPELDTLTDGSDADVLHAHATSVTAAASFTSDNVVLRSDGVMGRGAQHSSVAILDTGVMSIPGLGTGGYTDYDLNVGDVTTPDYGIIRMGNAAIGRTSHNAGSIDLDGAVLFRNIGGPVTSEIEFVFAESTGTTCRFALPKSGVGNATYNPRSMLIAGPAPADTDFVKVSYWQTQGIFHNLACDTTNYGADLGVQFNCEIENNLYVDTIIESTTAAGVTIESVLLKDGLVDGVDVATSVTAAAASGAQYTVQVSDGADRTIADTAALAIFGNAAVPVNVVLRAIHDAGTGELRWYNTNPRWHFDSGLQCAAHIVDASANEIIKLASVASALNEVTITNAATTNPALMTATGEANAALTIGTSGTGIITLAAATALGGNMDCEGNDIDDFEVLNGVHEDGTCKVELHSYSATATQAGRIITRRARGTVGSEVVPNSGDSAGDWICAAWDGDQWRFPGQAGFEISGAVSDNVTPVKFYVELGRTARSEVFTISDTGDVAFPTSGVTVAFADTNHFIHHSAGVGLETEVPTGELHRWTINTVQEMVLLADTLNFGTSGAVDGGLSWSTADQLDIKAVDTIVISAQKAGGNPLLSFYGGTPVVQAAAMTANLTTITHTAPGTPDYALQNVVDSDVGSAWGFASQDEGNTLLQVVERLQAEVAELRAMVGATAGVGLAAH